MAKTQRIPKTRDLFNFLVKEANAKRAITPELAAAHLGLRARIFDVEATHPTPQFTDETKSMIFVNKAIQSAIKCPVCGGLLDSAKSVSYNHKISVKDGGTGDQENAQMVHPYCNTAIRNRPSV